MNPDISELRARFQTVDFKVTRRCPWWVGKAPVVANAVDWVSNADAAAIYRLHDGRYVAVVAAARGRRSNWAIADLSRIQ